MSIKSWVRTFNHMSRLWLAVVLPLNSDPRLRLIMLTTVSARERCV
jgi:hypothetical protein